MTPPTATLAAATTAGEPTFRGRQPTELRFGTSGLRGLVREMTDLEVYVNARGFLAYLVAVGETGSGNHVAIGEDLRAVDPQSGLESSPRIARAVARAARDEGLRPLHCGRLPTPALAYYATAGGSAPEQRAMPAIMVTGSHIPADRNGVKFYRSTGEILKGEESAILEAVRTVRRWQYAEPAAQSPFDDAGYFRTPELPCATEPAAMRRYLARYLEPWAGTRPLARQRVVVWQHSAVGRDLLVELLDRLGAEPVPVDRTDDFVAVDTEDLDAFARDRLRRLAAAHQPHAIVSTDGDSDRPLLADEQGEFWPGDVVGIITAEALGARYAAVPVTTTDALERRIAERAAGAGAPSLEVERTRIGSPYVIAAMQRALEAGHERVVAWEANGGFLTGSELRWAKGRLAALPTRDAMLPLVCCLTESARRGCSISQLFGELPARRSRSGLVDGVCPDASRAALARLHPTDLDLVELRFDTRGRVAALRMGGPGAAQRVELASEAEAVSAERLRAEVARHFDELPSLGPIAWLNFVDGLRIGFAHGDVAHLRPSGNAPQLRVYALSDTLEQAARIVELAVREPDGVIARLVGAAR